MGYCSQPPAVAHFGLKPKQRYDVEVIFADKHRVAKMGAETGQTLMVKYE